MKHRVSKPHYLRDRGWTRIEVAVWLLALVAMITIGILFSTKTVGSWALFVGVGIVGAVTLLRYRAETEQKKRDGTGDN
jgi:hypothetical protein